MGNRGEKNLLVLYSGGKRKADTPWKVKVLR